MVIMERKRLVVKVKDHNIVGVGIMTVYIVGIICIMNILRMLVYNRRGLWESRSSFFGRDDDHFFGNTFLHMSGLTTAT